MWWRNTPLRQQHQANPASTIHNIRLKTPAKITVRACTALSHVLPQVCFVCQLSFCLLKKLVLGRAASLWIFQPSTTQLKTHIYNTNHWQSLGLRGSWITEKLGATDHWIVYQPHTRWGLQVAYCVTYQVKNPCEASAMLVSCWELSETSIPGPSSSLVWITCFGIVKHSFQHCKIKSDRPFWAIFLCLKSWCCHDVSKKDEMRGVDDFHQYPHRPFKIGLFRLNVVPWLINPPPSTAKASKIMYKKINQLIIK